MINHHTLVIIRKIGDPRIVEIHDKVEMIKFVDGEWQVVLKDGVVHHYPSSSYVFELIDSLNYYNNKTFTVFFVDGSSKTFPNTHDIYPIYGRQDGTHLVYTSVLDIKRKWNHDIKGNELYIRMYERNNYDGFGSIDKIVIIPECDIKKFIIKRTDHEDLVINVNGGTYRDE